MRKRFANRLPAECLLQMGVGIAPGLTHRLDASRHRNRDKVRQPPALPVIRQQKFTAPQAAVTAVAQSIHRHAQHRSSVQWHAMFSHAGSNMGVVMLYLQQLNLFCMRSFTSQLGGEIIRMAIDRDKRRPEVEKLAIQPKIVAEILESGGVLQIAHVL